MPPQTERGVTPAELAQRLRTETEAEQREEIVGELWDLGTPEAVEILRQQFHLERDIHVKTDIVAGVLEEQRPETREVRFGILATALAATQPGEVRETAVAMLSDFDDVRAIALLQNLLQDADADIRESAQDAIETRRERDAK